jgi:NUMOD3 motif
MQEREGNRQEPKSRLPVQTRAFVQEAFADKETAERIDQQMSEKPAKKQKDWERKKWLLVRYVVENDTTLDRVKIFAGVGTAERARQLYMSALTTVWEASSEKIQNKFPAEDVLVGKTRGGRHEVTEETRQRLSNSHRGKKISPETREKMSVSQRGRTHSPETREKMSVSHRGWTPSPETRAKMSAAKKGKPRSDDTKLKLSAALKTSEAAIRHRTEVLLPANRGRRRSTETRLKMSEAQRERYRRTREAKTQQAQTIFQQPPLTPDKN